MSETLKGILDRGILVGITWLLTQASAKGYLSQGQIADLAPALALVIGTAIAVMVNRPGSLAAAAGKTGSVVISPPSVAAAADTPNVLPTTASSSEIASAVKDAKADA